jgi:hypothetical protein
MNEQDIRALVREAIERHLGRPGGYRSGEVHRAAVASDRESIGSDRESIGGDRESIGGDRESIGRARLQSSHIHPSHIILNVLPGSEVDEGACVIEPAVRCNHCGFCQSYGH